MTEEERKKLAEENQRKLEAFISDALASASQTAERFGINPKIAQPIPRRPLNNPALTPETLAWEQYYRAQTERDQHKQKVEETKEARKKTGPYSRFQNDDITAISDEELAKALDINAKNEEDDPSFWRIPSKEEIKDALDPIEIGPKDDVSVQRGQDVIPTDVVDLVKGLEDPKPKADDPYYRSSILPLKRNERTDIIEFDPLESGPLAQINEMVKLSDQLSDPTSFVDDPTKITEQDSLNRELLMNDAKEQLAGNAMWTALGLTTAPVGLGREVMPNEISAGWGFMKPSKQAMKATKAAPSAFKITDIDPSAPPNLFSLERPKDLYKTQWVDDKQVLIDLAERAGVPHLDVVSERIIQDTQNVALMRVNEAIRSGKLTTSTGTISFRTPPEVLYQRYKALPDPEQIQLDRMLKLQDYGDDMVLVMKRKPDANTQALAAQGNKAAQKKINQMAADAQKARAELITAQQQVQQIKQSFPHFKDFERDYKSITGAVRNFLSYGKSAVFDRKALIGLARDRPNYVPIDITGVDPTKGLLTRIAQANRATERIGGQDWFVKKRELSNFKGVDNRVDSFEMLIDYTRNALRMKMENDVKHEFIDGLKKSANGAKTVRRLKPNETGKYGDHTVEVYEGGRKRLYLTSKLQADLLRFDPYIAKHPFFFAPKRLFEHGTTGPLSITFAPMTAIRDTVAGAVLQKNGLPKPGPISTLMAIPKQLVPKLALETSNILKSSLQDIPFFNKQTIAQTADSLANYYAKSLYHLSNTVGGIDASLMKNNIEYGRGAMREVARTANHYIDKVPGGHTTVKVLQSMAQGWDAIFSAISDAPRFAVFDKQVKAGTNPATAAVKARQLTGDTGRGGKIFRADGPMIQADVQNPAWLAPAKVSGHVAALAKESIPYWNPAIQGLRRLATRMIENPVEVNMNAWKYVGIPSLAAVAWNETLGKEYNDYAQNQRTAQDQAMNIYIGIPGLPPEQGIEMPIAHEMTIWNSMWSKALYGMVRGDDEIGEQVVNQGRTILTNLSPMGFPTALAVPMQVMGVRPPQSIPGMFLDGASEYRDEPDTGVFSGNVERTIRAMFGSISDVALKTAAAVHDGGPAAFFDELGWQLGKRTPIVKNLIGADYRVTAFTPEQEKLFRKMDAFRDFKKVYDTWYGENSDKVADRLGNLDMRPDFVEPDVPLQKLSPNLGMEPQNPLIKMFGDTVAERLGKNTDGMSALEDRYAALNEQVKLLKGYNSGRTDAFREYQRKFTGAVERFEQKKLEIIQQGMGMNKKELTALAKTIRPFEEAAKAEKLLKDLNIDLGKRNDVIKLINHLEAERYKLVVEQLKIVQQVEDDFTTNLVNQGLLKEGERFEIEKHLKPTLKLGQ